MIWGVAKNIALYFYGGKMKLKKIIKSVLLVCLLCFCSSAKAAKTYPLELKPTFVSLAINEAKYISKEYGIPISAIVAQAIYESGHGKSELARKYHNYFGLKALSGWNGKTAIVSCNDGESPYRVYNNMRDGFYGYAKFLQQSRYASAFKNKENGEKFIQSLLKAGYCNDKNYMSDIKIIMKRYNLYKYDVSTQKPPTIIELALSEHFSRQNRLIF